MNKWTKQLLDRVRAARPETKNSFKLVDTAKALAADQSKKTKNVVQNARRQATKQFEQVQKVATNKVFKLSQDSKLKLKDVGSSVSNASQRATAAIVDASKTTVQNAQERVSSISRNALDTTSTISRNALNATASASRNALNATTSASRSALNATTSVSRDALNATTDRVKALPSSFTQASLNVLETVDPREKARKLRNQIIFYVFSAIFVYGFATAIPPAVSKYMIEKERLAQQQSKLEEHTQK